MPIGSPTRDFDEQMKLLARYRWPFRDPLARGPRGTQPRRALCQAVKGLIAKLEKMEEIWTREAGADRDGSGT